MESLLTFTILLQKRDAGAMEFTHNFFKQIMWRSSKVQVADELQLPPQEECLSWLIFSPIEEHFYQRQHETCLSCAREVIESFKDNIPKRGVPGCEWSPYDFIFSCISSFSFRLVVTKRNYLFMMIETDFVFIMSDVYILQILILYLTLSSLMWKLQNF